MISASQYHREEEVYRSDMVKHLINAKQCVFTVAFRKKLDPRDIQERLLDNQGFELNEKFAKELSEGKLRTLTCFKTEADDEFGRSLVIDLESEWGKGFRQIDHRTIEELILFGTKYTLKK